MNYAPVALFVYNRPWHTRQTVEALLANAEASVTALYVFSDAPKDVDANEDVAKVRSFLREITGFKSATIVEREKNLGLARSVIDGVSQICNEHGSAIVLEDDLVVSPYFLKFMNEGLEKYRDEQRVISIHGYVYPVDQALPETFFLKGADCWGWATWKRGWDSFNHDGQSLLDELRRRKLTCQFDFDGSYPYTKMLRDQIAGKNNSWAILWYASAFVMGKLTLYPGRSLVHNIGVDGSGFHCSESNQFSAELSKIPIVVTEIAIEDAQVARQRFIEFHKRTRPILPIRVANKIFRRLQRMKKSGNGR